MRAGAEIRESFCNLPKLGDGAASRLVRLSTGRTARLPAAPLNLQSYARHRSHKHIVSFRSSISSLRIITKPKRREQAAEVVRVHVRLPLDIRLDGLRSQSRRTAGYLK